MQEHQHNRHDSLQAISTMNEIVISIGAKTSTPQTQQLTLASCQMMNEIVVSMDVKTSSITDLETYSLLAQEMQ